MMCYRSQNMRKGGVGVMVSTEPRAVAATVAGLAREGHFAEIAELFAPRLRAMVSAETLRAGWAGEISKVGPVVAVGEPVSEPAEAGLVRVSVPMTCEHGELTVVMSVDDAGMLHGLRLALPAVTAWEPPSYSAPERFAEHEVTVGAGPLAIPGTLTLPRGRGPRPGVVLLSGGGPFDRDETSGVNKPLKDLAWGLASRGVAVARFDKVTFAHGHLATEPGFTMTDEYVPYAVAAVRLLQQQSSVDPERVFVLGHSMGGRVAPRVAAAEASVAGLVILAGDTQPMQHAAVRVVGYLASVIPDSIPQAAVEAFTRQAALIDSPDLSLATPAVELPFGWPASYWLDLRGDDPVATAAALDKPMLILQGGRDYQVTVDDDLTGWRTGLAHRPDVVIRVYDADNHLFFPGSGPSTPAEYEPPQHVDPAVVADIAEWLAPDQSRPTSPDAAKMRA
jgi:dienelactone hydrolase